MGLIRSGYTDLTPEDDDKLVGYLWPIIREIVKTAIENRQNLVIEGCYIPFDWAADFDPFTERTFVIFAWLCRKNMLPTILTIFENMPTSSKKGWMIPVIHWNRHWHKTGKI